MKSSTGTIWAKLVAVAAIGAFAGCAVPQKPGKGKVMHLREPRTRAGYWLYLPEDYVKTNGQRPDGARWPLVMTFHGLRPYDDANPQIREWQEEADRYGFIVCAPELQTCDTLVIVPPLNTAEKGSVKRDEKAILAIMDDVFKRTQADPTRVLSTSFSCGGYFAHYMPNRYPERFTCIAVRQSNFSSEMMDPRQTAKYRDMKIAIFFGENDFKLCRDESREAVAWYRQHRFNVTAKYVGGLGHERTPQTAAAFFARVINVEPKTPPPFGTLVMYDIDGGLPPLASAAPAGRTTSSLPPPLARPSSNAIFPPATGGGGSDSAGAAGAVGPGTPRPSDTPLPVSTPAPPRLTPKYTYVPQAPRRAPPRAVPPRATNSASPSGVEIRLSTRVGVTPLWVSYHAELPEAMRKGSSILWTDNGRPISTALSGYSVLREVGEHCLEALIITEDDREIRVSETVTVLPRLTTRPVAGM